MSNLINDLCFVVVRLLP